MSVKQLPWFVSILGFLLPLPQGVCQIVTPQLRLLAQPGTITFDGLADNTHGLTKWSHRVFLYRTIGDRLPVFHVLDREGKLISSAIPTIPEATRVWVHDFDRGLDGSIVFAGPTPPMGRVFLSFARYLLMAKSRI